MFDLVKYDHLLVAISTLAVLSCHSDLAVVRDVSKLLAGKVVAASGRTTWRTCRCCDCMCRSMRIVRSLAFAFGCLQQRGCSFARCDAEQTEAMDARRALPNVEMLDTTTIMLQCQVPFVLLRGQSAAFGFFELCQQLRAPNVGLVPQSVLPPVHSAASQAIFHPQP